MSLLGEDLYIGNNLIEYNNLISNVDLQARKDTVIWTINKSDSFAVRSM